MVVMLHEKGIPVISEIEFAGRYARGKKICITGSNVKTTVTNLLYHILKKAGFNVAMTGNVGNSFAMAVATADFDYYVIELSSFQLDGMYDFRADIAVLLNITPDHLDRYGYKLQNYVDSKTGAHTQTIKGSWNHVKGFLPVRGMKPQGLSSYLGCFMWDRFCKQSWINLSIS